MEHEENHAFLLGYLASFADRLPGDAEVEEGAMIHGIKCGSIVI